MSITSKGIYYPDDYTHVADVPEDFKKLAESVNTAIEDLDTNKVDKVDGKGLSTNDFTNEDKAKLDGLNNYDDTEITQEIEDIQEEQAKQNEDIEDLKQNDAKQDDLIQKLKDNSINVTTEEATSLHVTDASTLPAKLEVRGNHSQKTREGYNIWDYLSAVLSSAGGLTIEKDYENGYITVNGMPSKDYVSIVSTAYITNLLEDGQRYTLWQENYQNEETAGIYLQVARTDDNGTTRYYSLSNSATFLVDKSNNASYSIILQTSTVANTKTLSNYKNRYMLYKGTEDKTYELPGASPSLDYPSEVRAVGDNVNILPNNAVSTSHNGVNYTINEDGSIYAVGTATSNSQVILAGQLSATEEVFKFKKGIQYKNVGNVRITYRKTDGNYGQISPSSILAPEEDISIGCLYIEVVKNYSVDILYYPKIVEYYEGMNESYSPYGQGSVEIKKINKNFYKLDVEGLSRNGVDYFVENGIVTAKRTATVSSGSYFNTNRVKLPAGIYIISGIDDTFVYANARVEVYISDKIDGNATQITTLTNTRLSYKYTSDKPFYLSFGFVVTGETDVNDTFIFKPQAEKNVATDFEEHKEQSLVLDIQKPMLKGDYFVKESDGWKEVHHFYKFIATASAGEWEETKDWKNRYKFDGQLDISNRMKSLDNTNQFCSHSNECFNWGLKIGTFQVRSTAGFYFTTDKFNSNEEFNQFIAEQEANGTPLTFWFEAKEYELDCTKEQSAVLDKLEELELFKGTNNIITAESLALIQMQYIADTVTYIDNRIDEKLANINQQLLEIVGGN